MRWARASRRYRSRSKRPRKQTRQNQAAITKVDAKADQVGIWAKDAQTSARTLSTLRRTRSKLRRRCSQVDAVDAASKRLVYEVVINEDQGNFKFASAELPEEAQARIDEMVAQLKANPRGNFVEIEGHTDSSGDKMINQRIGEARAEAVKRYLYEHASGAAAQDERHQLRRRQAGQPEQHPAGRAQNRRVVIRILA